MSKGTSIPTVMDRRTFEALGLLGFRFTSSPGATWFPSEKEREARKGARMREALLPDGWTTKGAPRGLYTELLDTEGRRRAIISIGLATLFGDPAFSLLTRYAVEAAFHPDIAAGTRTYTAIDRRQSGDPLFASPSLYRREEEPRAFQARAEAEAWLDRHFPAWRDPLAYWDAGIGAA